MKNLVNLSEDQIERQHNKLSKEEYFGYRRSWWNYIKKVCKVNIENLLGMSRKQITQKYLHTLPEQYRDVRHLMSFLGIYQVAADGQFIDPLYGIRWYSFYRRRVYYFNEQDILTVKITQRRKSKKVGTRRERLKKFYEDKRASRKSKRAQEKAKAEISYEFLTEKEKRNKYNSLDEQKIIAHGMDPKTSFRGKN